MDLSALSSIQCSDNFAVQKTSGLYRLIEWYKIGHTWDILLSQSLFWLTSLLACRLTSQFRCRLSEERGDLECVKPVPIILVDSTQCTVTPQSRNKYSLSKNCVRMCTVLITNTSGRNCVISTTSRQSNSVVPVPLVNCYREQLSPYSTFQWHLQTSAVLTESWSSVQHALEHGSAPEELGTHCCLNQIEN